MRTHERAIEQRLSSKHRRQIKFGPVALVLLGLAVAQAAPLSAQTLQHRAANTAMRSVTTSGRVAKKPDVVPMRERLAILHRTYRDLIYSVTNNTIRLMNNSIVVVDDGRKKSHIDKVRDADIEDQLSQVYPLGKCYRRRSRRNIDPGRIRSNDFFRRAYGPNLWRVKQNTTELNWFGTKVRFSTRHGAAKALRRVRDELKRLPEKFHEALKSPRRVLDWQAVPATDRISIHGFAIAIDLNPQFSNHWRRASAKIGKLRRYRNRIHPEIVAIFEKHGFIWAGKWYRFNTGHFEYRPALIAIAKLAQQRGCEK